MVFHCCAFGCTNRQGKAGIRFFRFPMDKERRNKWIAAIKRKNWVPSEYSRLCSAHFITGKHSKDPSHPDYIPTLFVFNNPVKGAGQLLRYKRNISRRKEQFVYHRILTRKIDKKRVSRVSDKESATDTGNCDEVLDSHDDANDDDANDDDANDDDANDDDANDDEYDNGEILEYDDEYDECEYDDMYAYGEMIDDEHVHMLNNELGEMINAECEWGVLINTEYDDGEMIDDEYDIGDTVDDVYEFEDMMDDEHVYMLNNEHGEMINAEYEWGDLINTEYISNNFTANSFEEVSVDESEDYKYDDEFENLSLSEEELDCDTDNYLEESDFTLVNSGDREEQSVDEESSQEATYTGRIHEIDLELESKEIEIGEYQLEIEQLKETITRYERKHVSMQEKISLLTQENAMLKSSNSRAQWLNFSNSRSILALKANNEILHSKLERHSFGASSIKDNDNKTNFYTGLPTYKLFLCLFNQLKPLFKSTISRHPLIDEFFVTLVKLRLGVPHMDLAYRMDVGEGCISTIFSRWVNVMSVEFKCLISWPDKETLLHNMPKSFRKHYSNVRCIIDCFEVFIQRPTNLMARAQTFSNYKKHNTMKVLIGVSPTGTICFISDAWGGRVSDKVITQQSGFLKKVEHGDYIMADRGFNVGEDLAICGAKLLIPAYTKGKTQLSASEVEQTRQLARVRIHVERVIGQLRKKYKILQQVFPISLIKQPTDTNRANCLFDRILIVTAGLTNLSPTVVSN